MVGDVDIVAQRSWLTLSNWERRRHEGCLGIMEASLQLASSRAGYVFEEQGGDAEGIVQPPITRRSLGRG